MRTRLIAVGGERANEGVPFSDQVVHFRYTCPRGARPSPSRPPLRQADGSSASRNRASISQGMSASPRNLAEGVSQPGLTPPRRFARTRASTGRSGRTGGGGAMSGSGHPTRSKNRTRPSLSSRTRNPSSCTAR